MGHEVGDVGDGLGPGGEPRNQVGVDDAAHALRPFRAGSAQVLVGGGHPGVRHRGDIGADLWGRNPRLAADGTADRVGDGPPSLYGGDGLVEPGPRLVLSGEPFLSSLDRSLRHGQGGAPASLTLADRPGERPAHQLVALLPRVSTVSWRRKRSSSSWRATSSSRAARRASARASSVLSGSDALSVCRGWAWSTWDSRRRIVETGGDEVADRHHPGLARRGWRGGTGRRGAPE